MIPAASLMGACQWHHGEPGNGKFATPSGPAREPGSAGCISTGQQIDGVPRLIDEPHAASREPAGGVAVELWGVGLARDGQGGWRAWSALVDVDDFPSMLKKVAVA